MRAAQARVAPVCGCASGRLLASAIHTNGRRAMHYKNPISGFALGLGALLALATGVASADVTTEQKVSLEGVGAMAIVNLSGTTKTAISGNKSRSDSDLQMQSKLVRFLARNAGGPTAEIVLLDADKMYTLKLNKKEYTETSFADFRDRMQKAAQGKGDHEEDKQPSAVDQSKCEWLEPKSDVKKTGKKATIAGFEADEIVITAEQPCKDKETGAICEIALTLDEWMSTSYAANEEVARYQKAYAQKLGADTVLSKQDVSDRAQTMFSQYKGVWANVVDKMKGTKGYPVKSSFALSLGGDHCKQAQQQQASGAGEGSTGSSDSSSGDLTHQVGAKLGSLFHRKKDDSSDQSAQTATPPPATGPSGTVTLVTISTELVSVSATPIPAGAFEIPAGFKKVEPKRAS